jgi:hypothetical protein
MADDEYNNGGGDARSKREQEKKQLAKLNHIENLVRGNFDACKEGWKLRIRQLENKNCFVHHESKTGFLFVLLLTLPLPWRAETEKKERVSVEDVLEVTRMINSANTCDADSSMRVAAKDSLVSDVRACCSIAPDLIAEPAVS